MEEQEYDAAATGRRQEEIHTAWRAGRTSEYTSAAIAAPVQAHTPLPAAAALLGYGGLLPLLTLSAGTVLGGMHADLWRAALFAYAAVILSFVGALHWGIALAAPGLTPRQRSALFAWSVVPALLAWPALLVYAQPATVLLIAGFAAHYAQDWRLVRRLQGSGMLPDWYLPLRLRLTLVACGAIAAGGLWVNG